MNPSHEKKFAELKKYYEESATKDTFNALVYGDMGTGKTRLFRTCRRPVFIHSFDPGGTKTVKDCIDEGWMFVDTRFEGEDPGNPKVYEMWLDEMKNLQRMDFFSSLGTYGLDSLTTWAQSIMGFVLKGKGRPGTFPWQEDYGPQMARIESHVKSLTSLPCDVLVTAHPDQAKDDRSGRMFIGPLVTGKLRTRLPILFDEIYAMITESKPGGTVYNVLTQNDGLYRCRTRLGREGLYSKHEKPDIKYLLRKAGLPAEDVG